VMKGVMETFDLAGKHSVIEVDVASMPRIKGDPLLLAHVFENLISNSIKFRRSEDLVIEVEAKLTGDIVIISVTDNGIGIEPQFADQVFDMFARLHDEDEYEGNGIGLTVCRKIISDHGGRIWIDKGYSGAGTRINMTLLPAAGERQIDPGLALLQYQTMHRSTRGPQPDDASIDRETFVRRPTARGHHAKFSRA
jgi:light-regulated signal transduction histidine kinase (bacteriophytochrome)